MIRPHRVALALILTAAFAAGCSETTETTDTAAPPAAPSAPAPVTSDAQPAAADGECGSIERAYTAWRDSLRATTAAEFAKMGESEASQAVDRGETLLKDVSGHDSQESKALAGSLTGYNFSLAHINLEIAMGNDVGSEKAGQVAEALGRVEEKYQAWKTKVCA